MRQLFSRLGWVMSGALGLILIASLAESTFGGPLDPPGPVGSTHLALQSWDRMLLGTDGTTCDSSRFKCVLNSNAAVLDRETGLVWVRNASFFAEESWPGALDQCGNITVGGRSGWRLPTLEELMTLFELTNTNPDASLPNGFPILNTVDPDGYWTGTTYANAPSQAYVVDFLGPSAGVPGGKGQGVLKSTTLTYRAWCVRGGQGHDGM